MSEPMSTPLLKSLEEKGLKLTDVIDLRSRIVFIELYKLEEKTKGGVFLPGSYVEVETFENRLGLVHLIGPNSYEDKEYYPNGPLCEVGEYIVYAKHDASFMTINGVKCAFLPANKVLLTTKYPEVVKTTYSLNSI